MSGEVVSEALPVLAIIEPLNDPRSLRPRGSFGRLWDVYRPRIRLLDRHRERNQFTVG